MALIDIKTRNLQELVTFCPDPNLYNFSDIVNSDFNGGVPFVEAPGFYVYRAVLVLDDREAAQHFATNLRFDFYTSNPQHYDVTSQEPAVSCKVSFEMQNFEIIDVPVIVHSDVKEYTQRQTKSVTVPTRSPLEVYVTTDVMKSEFDKTSVPKSKKTLRHSNSAAGVNASAKSRGRDPAAETARGSTSGDTAEFAHSKNPNPGGKDNSNTRNSPANRTSVNAEWKNRKSLRQVREKIRKDVTSGRTTAIAEAHRQIEEPVSQTVWTKKVDMSRFMMLPTKRLITQDFYLDKEKLGEVTKVYVIVRAEYDEHTKKISAETFKSSAEEYSLMFHAIAHREQLTEFLQNPAPPLIELRHASLSKVSFRLTRTDPTLREVRIVRIIENPNRRRPIVSLGKKVFFGAADVLEVTDLTNNIHPNTITYRFVSINGDNSLGGFSSVVIPSFKKIIDQNTTARTRMTIFASNKNQEILIDVRLLTTKVFSMRLLREDLHNNGTFSERVVQIPIKPDHPRLSQELLVKNTAGTHRFFDRTAILGRKYRYFVAYRQYEYPLIASLSQEIISDEDEVIIRRFPYMHVPFTAKLSSPSMFDDGSGYTAVEWNVTVTETENSIKNVIKSLQEAGFDKDFITALQSDNIKSKDFIMFLVERYSTETGRRESFGIIPPGKFIDNDVTRSAHGVSPLTEGKYRYVFKMCLQDPRTLLQTTHVTILDKLGGELKKKASRFMRRNFARMGVMPSDKDVLGGVSINKLIEETQTGHEFESTIQIPKKLPEIETVEVKELYLYNSITWKVLGNTREISYFAVSCNVNGSVSLLGANSICPGGHTYKFRDEICASHVGAKTYSVKAVGFDGEELLRTSAPPVYKTASVPLEAIGGVLMGEQDGVAHVTVIPDGTLASSLAAESQPEPNPFPPGSLGADASGVVQNKLSLAAFLASNSNAGKALPPGTNFGIVEVDYENFNPTGGRWFGADRLPTPYSEPSVYGENRDVDSLIAQNFTFVGHAKVHESDTQYTDEQPTNHVTAFEDGAVQTVTG
tara:strand:+ start:1303 stop:4398 length:3096 start_codon:yes stop_codon:yes gene_type:complete